MSVQSIRTKLKTKRTSWNKGFGDYVKGERNPKWNGDISTENGLIRGSIKYKLWRRIVHVGTIN